MAISLREKYADMLKQIANLSVAAAKIDETNVYQKENPQTRKFMDALVAENMAEGSRLEGKENFRAFLDAVKNGKHGLILMEHYSNTDLPALCYLLEHDLGEDGKDLSKRIVAIAGMKLNEANPLVRAFAESFTRVVIYPTRSLTKAEEKAKSEEEKIEEEKRARTINLAAMRAMDKCKRDGEVILVFPSGTRYRPGHPETKRGLREIDSYLRMFDVMILVTINGSALTIDMNNPDDMLADLVAPDVQIFTASPVIDCKQFRKDYLATLPESEPDPKQKVIDHIMEIFDEQHDKIEKLR
ncbi:MAG: 1-acyl-sn-glycerol-3-phosphate acyltransferase [Treponema sp.]|uniref:1-acyl-sn-glycerol-3-phosphate acyltransferase n=1 Tax=Treponema sp. TaxID=166 RepID=UPI0025E063FA|nr:1-acyl-sn-glycerol-3-phosphate acyltransferase [Treponema sp.]MBR0497378.1 1-acyl-sn-glycerol-3-phosphate acyltransferase [Treponema sp.]